MAKNKETSTRGTGKAQSGTRDQLIKDLQHVHKLFPTAKPDRDFYRKHGKYADAAWKEHFPRFKDFVAAARPVPTFAEVCRRIRTGTGHLVFDLLEAAKLSCTLIDREGTMSKVRVAAFSVSLDGFGAGPRQDLKNPLGVRGTELHEWFFQTEAFKKRQGQSGNTQIDDLARKASGSRGVDNDLAERSFENIGAWILGRNMFGPIRGPWKDDSWRGWWGANPPFHTPVFVLTHFERDPLMMDGGTMFSFVTDGIESALAKAKDAAQGKEVRIGGGVSVIRQYLATGLIDEMHLAFAPVVLGEGEHLFSGMNLDALGFAPTETVMGKNAMHVVLRK